MKQGSTVALAEIRALPQVEVECVTQADVENIAKQQLIVNELAANKDYKGAAAA